MTASAPRASRKLLEGQNRILEMIAQGGTLSIILDALLGMIQEHSPELLCSILLLDPDGVHVRHGAARGLPQPFVRAVDGLAIGPQAGSCGTAAFRREQVIVEDVAIDPLWDDYRELAFQSDLRACWSTPIFDARRRVLGTFAIYAHEPGRPDAQQLQLIGVCTHIASIAITKNREAEALRTSEDRLLLALSCGNVDIWEYDLETSQLVWHGPKSIFDQRADAGDSSLQSFVDTVHPEDREKVQSAFQYSPHGLEAEFRIIYRDGSVHWFLSKGRPEYDSRGKALRVRGIALEISERKRAEEEIRSREAQLAEAQSIAHLGSYEWDLRTRTVRRSDELYRIFGLAPDEFEPTYEGYLARVHPEDRARTKAIVDGAFERAEPFDFEERIVWPDASIRSIRSQGRWRFDDQHRPIELLGICQDITERKQIEQQLVTELKERTRAEQEIQALAARLINAQEEERSRLARELHDDLCQQIAALSIAASNLKKEIAPENTEARAQSERIRQKLIQMAEGVRRLSHNLHPAVLEYSGLGAALESYCAEFSTLTGIAVSCHAEGSFEGLPAPVALGLYRIAQEALQNVLKHAQVKEAKVGIARSAETVRLTVSDTGAGVDLDQTDVPRGLGLLNIKERARLVKGTVRIESGRNEGTQLEVTVPLQC